MGKPSDTSFLSAVSSNGKVIVSWNKSTNASGYNLYRKVGTGSYSLVQKITSTSTLTFEDTNVTEKTQYTYQIKPYTYNTAYGINVEGNADTISAYYVKPNTVNSIISLTDGVTLTFDTDSNASGYKVYRDTDDGNFTCIATISDKSISSYTDTTAVDGYFYNYYATSYYQVSGKTYEGICTNSYRVRRFNTPTVNASAKSASSIGVTWNSNVNVTGYEIAYSGDGVNETIKQPGTATSATITGLGLGKTYSLKVRAYYEEGGTTWTSNWSASKTVTVEVDFGSVTIEKLSYTYTGKQITPKVVAKDSAGNVISSNYYKVTYGTNKSIGKGTVQVVFNNGYSGTKDLEFKIVPTTTSISNISNTSEGIVIKWAKNGLASGYKVYRIIDSGSAECIATISSNATTSYTDAKATKEGSKYQYKLITYTKVDSTTYSSDYSSVVLTYRLINPKISSVANASGGLTIKWAKNAKATGYIIYRSIDGGSYSKIKTITSNSTVSFTDTGVKSSNGKKIAYRVYAYKTVSSKDYQSSYSSKTYYRLTSPTNMTATNTKTRSITVKWGKNTKATGYEVRYKLGSTTKTVKVTSASTVSKVIKSLTKGKTYTVDVRAYKTVSGTTYYSAWSTAKKVKISK